MKSSRREFLKRGTLGALAAGVPLGLSEKVSARGTATSSASVLNVAAFKSQLGTRFTINDDVTKVNVTLVEVTNLASRKQTAAGKEGFSLLFRGPGETILKQNTYLIEHAELGMLSFLVVPVRTGDTRSPHYEAIINRLHP
jgi:uncharacterized protein DUF6916